MAITAQVTISGLISGLQTGSKIIGPITIANTAATDLTSGQTQTLTLASGLNTITLPSTACVGCVITFASASTVTKTLKGVTGDTGVTLLANGSNVINFSSPATATFVITAGGADTGNTTEIVFF